MDTTATTNTTTATTTAAAAKKTTDTTASKSTTALQGLSDNFDNFLRLLVTQMQNQDPLDPLDNNQMTQQLVNFTQVEQAIGMNQKLEQLVNFGQTNETAISLSYLGRLVEAEGNSIPFTGGDQTTISYELPKAADKATVNILDSDGNTVRTLTGNTASGMNRLTWDGNDEYGNKQTAGVFTFKVQATKGNGTSEEAVVADPRTTGWVSQVDLDESGGVLVLGTATGKPDVKVPISDVKDIRTSTFM